MKTGSTSVQVFLEKNRSALESIGLAAPDCAVSPLRVGYNSTALRAYSTTPKSKHFGPRKPRWFTDFGISSPEDHARFKDKVQQDLRLSIKKFSSRCDKFIFSSEILSMASDDSVVQLKTLFQGHFDEMKIIVYLRRQDQMLSSMYSTDLRNRGETQSIDTYAKRNRGISMLLYDRVLDRWASVFGEEAIVPRIYEGTGQGRFDTVADLMGELGVSDLSAFVRPTSVNRGLSAETQERIRQINLKVEQKIETRESASKLVRLERESAAGKGQELSPDTASYVLGHFRSGNERVRQRWFPERETLFAPHGADSPKVPA